MPEPTLAQLRAFTAAARKGSVSAAAVHLNLTQSAVSHALRQLEGQLGLRLLERHGRGVALNDAGRRLLPLAEQVLAQVELFGRAADAATALSGVVRIASFPSLARHLLPPSLTRLARDHPALRLELDDSHLERSAVIQAVQAGQAEIGLTQLLPGMSLVAHTLGEDPYELIAPRAWPLPDLWARPYIHLGDPRDLRVPDALARRGLHLRPGLSLSTETAILAMVAGELGFAILPRMTLPDLPENVVRHPLPWAVTRSYGTVVRHGPLSPAVRVVLAVLQSASGSQPTAGKGLE
ncbi:hypothetical protein DEIPH_ctg026orf0030 [Deinococcus phoenicis]|uniref:HTH lysR-type domain-containing protein n=1 Tax=Deinococcus phoenicis TaxID=1476583 RepID=A0A016QQ83_9DEIO|nr:LysR family transcriptional regulator [Deinococcus phoenicis]EYB68131.1 hypothetical protein DEIPH_ctg026orf0030 [Deinococcus phoenicis]